MLRAFFVNTPYEVMKMAQSARTMIEKTLAFLSAKKTYVAVIGGLLVVGVVGAAVLWPKPAEPEPDPVSIDDPVSGSKDERLEEALSPTPTPEATPTPTPVPDFTSAPSETKNPGVPAQKYPAPVAGKVIWGFAVDELIYSVTLDQWMTHAGVDIGCRLGTDVAAVRAGKVKQVYEDDRMGVTVVLEHSGGLVSVYANLAKEPPMAEGDRVKQGDVIGITGDTALAECKMDPHLHFELLLDNAWVNPADYLLLE